MNEYWDELERKDASEKCVVFEDLISTEFKQGDIVGIKFKPNSVNCIPLHKIADKFHLTYLSIPNNNITKITEDILNAFPYLNWLDLRNNKITQFPKTVGHRCLGTILLGGNKIDRLPIELGSFPELHCLQVSGNPLEFPEEASLERQGIDLVTYLKLCWKTHCEKPAVKQKPRKNRQVSKDEYLLKVKQLGNVASIVADKMKSTDPVDQILASHAVRKMRDIETKVQKSKDAELLDEWRKRYTPKKTGAKETARNPPYDVDPEFMPLGESRQEKKKIAPKKKAMKNNEDLELLSEELESLRAWKPALDDPALEKAVRMSDIRKMHAIMKKIRETDVFNP